MPVKRHATLQDLSRDHQIFLQEAQQIRAYLDDEQKAGTLEEIIGSILVFWESIGLIHLQEEEDIVYPDYLQHAPLRQRDITAMITDHNWLREKFQELADLPRFENSRPILQSINEYLVNHIRHEEQVIYPAIQETLSEEQLTQLAEKSQAFRKKHRGASSIGKTQDTIELIGIDIDD